MGSREGAAVGVNVNAIMPTAYTRLTAQIPDDPFRDLLEAHFGPELVAPFVVWLLHHETTVNGEVFSVGAGRAARVFLAEARGAVASEPTPEAWAACAADVLSNDGFGVPLGMNDEVRFAAEHLGGAVAESWERYAESRTGPRFGEGGPLDG